MAGWRTVHITLTAGPDAYLVPQNVGSLVFKNVDGAMTVYYDTRDSATPYSLAQNEALSFEGMNTPTRMYFTGTSGHKVHMTYVDGGVD